MGELRTGERIGGKYVLEERLGLGGMGEVWLAELQGAGAFRRRVVLKVLAPERRGDPRLASMLADEARVVGLLHHPAIVAAQDYLETEEYGPIFVLEFVDGTSLRTVLKLARRDGVCLPEALAAHVGAQVAHALHAAHQALDRDGNPLNVVHRDVAPDNILLSRSGAVFLGDFGVARAAGNSEVTEPGSPKGKLGYMAPEQALGKAVGPAADLFSLGRVIAEAADVNCGPALRAVLGKATAEKPSQRYASASEMAAALVHACPPPSAADRELARWLGHSSRLEQKPLFAAVPPPSRLKLKLAVGAGVLVLAAGLFFAAPRGRRLLLSAVSGAPAAAHGQLRVTCRPEEAEVYVDGSLRGTTPLTVELPAGKHSVRVGSPRLEHWRAAEVLIKDGVEHHLDIDLSE